MVARNRSDYQLLFQICMKDLAFVKNQQWKTVHLTLIALAALLIACKEIMCVYISCPFIILVTFIGLRFMHEHKKALLRYRDQKDELTNAMPAIYGRIHEKREEQKENKDVRSFSNMFVLIIVAFALFVFGYAVHNGGKSMTAFHCDIVRIALMTASYVLIIFGSLGMIVFATKFSFSTKIKDMELTKERFFCLNGYRVWWLSWSLIILGAVIQLVDFWL